MRDELKQFYQDVAAWVEDGCPSHDVFQLDCGLCSQLEMWSENQCHAKELTDQLWDEQAAMFQSAGLDKNFPFDTEESYNHAYYANAMYDNPERLNWIKEHAQ